MAGALSGHIINSFESSVSNQSICTDGLISFNPSMHGAFNPNMHSTPQSFSFNNPSHASTSMGESTYDRVSRVQAKLNQKLGPEFISQRPGPGGGPKLTYAEGWKVINVANEVFGFDGWSSNIVSLTTDYMDYNEETRRYNVGVSAVMRVTLKEGVFHEDVGYGMIENAKAKGGALDKCKKEAVTDGLKRTLRTFGNVLGNCLYDKQYTAEIVKIKVPPVKLEKGDLYRLPELSERPAPPAASTSASASTSAPQPANTTAAPARAVTVSPPAPAPQQQKWQPQPQQAPKPVSSVPHHMQPRTGLQTPITTPAPDRKVSFAPPAPPQAMPPPPVPAPDDNDDSFGFSDDDAFLACVDMGEGDLGQPIDFEEGAGAGCSNVSSVHEEEAPAESRQQQQQDDRYGPMGLGRTGHGPQHQQHRGAPPNVPLQQQQKAHTTATSTARDAPQKPISAGPRPAASTATGAYTLYRPPPLNAPNQNQNQKPPSTGASGAPTANAPPPAPAKRPSTPSVGGFHFPPGMPNPFLQPNNSRPPQGVKRGADAMIGASRTGTGAGMGMGLSGAGAGGGGSTRQPLGTLALDGQQYQQGGGGSDAKRVRR
ncbi:RAD52 DNA repair protein [Mycena maculata]|uniref:RAD52 DNA repair protein n=1 Tax=Mycena maculata TaxID=230809 RepID=A0AAD7I418_9AGAR|nr:RAD52 DNA repair protein [Mycena maculata]